MTRADLLSLAERLRALALWSGDGSASDAADLCEKLAELRPVAWSSMLPGGEAATTTRKSYIADGWRRHGGDVQPLYTLSEVLTDE